MLIIRIFKYIIFDGKVISDVGKRFPSAMIIFGFMMSACTVHAAPVVVVPQVDSGALATQKRQRENFNDEQQQLQRDDRPVITGPDPSASGLSVKDAGPHFMLKKVLFSTSVFLTQSELDAIAQPYIDRDVGLNDIQTIVGKVNELYKEKSIVTGLGVLSAQKITDGEVRIDLIEGKLGELTVSSQYTKPEFLLQSISLVKNQVIDINKVERDFEIFNRTHDIQLRASILPGSELGFSDLNILAEEPKRVMLKVFADNQNASSIGRLEAGVDARFNGFFGYGDFARMLVSKSEGSTNLFGEIGIPFNASGGIVAASYSKNDISIISGAYTLLDITGVSSRTSIRLNQPLYVDKNWKLASEFSYGKGDSKNYISGVMLSQIDINTYSATLSVDRQGPGYLWSTQQQFDFGNSKDQLNQTIDYVIYAPRANWMGSMTDSVRAVARGAAQYTSNNNLPPSALFQIGGPSTVRGYDPGIATGLNGFYANLELHRDLSPGLDCFVFVDHGEVHVPNTQKTQIGGYGVGVSWSWNQLNAQIIYARPLDIIRPDQSTNHLDMRVEVAFF